MHESPRKKDETPEEPNEYIPPPYHPSLSKIRIIDKPVKAMRKSSSKVYEKLSTVPISQRITQAQSTMLNSALSETQRTPAPWPTNPHIVSKQDILADASEEQTENSQFNLPRIEHGIHTTSSRWLGMNQMAPSQTYHNADDVIEEPELRSRQIYLQTIHGDSTLNDTRKGRTFREKMTNSVQIIPSPFHLNLPDAETIEPEKVRSHSGRRRKKLRKKSAFNRNLKFTTNVYGVQSVPVSPRQPTLKLKKKSSASPRNSLLKAQSIKQITISQTPSTTALPKKFQVVIP